MNVEKNEVKPIKGVVELKQIISESNKKFPDGTIIPTEDGEFIVISNKPVRVDAKGLNTVDPLELEFPFVGYEVVADRAVLVCVARQTQFTKEAMMSPDLVKISVQNASGMTVNQSYRKQRYFIVKASEGFSNGATGGKVVLGRGDEVILAAHLDGLPSFPIIEDPTGIVVSECISLHYTEIVGYVKWRK